MTYVDGFVAAVPTANREIYRKHAEAAAVVFKEHGALRVVECWSDDVPEGKLTSFPMAVKRKEDETVVFSWIDSQRNRSGLQRLSFAWPMKVSQDGPVAPESLGR